MYKQKSFNMTTEEARNQRKWFIIDATDKVVGRLATEVANILRGKNKPQYTPHADTGDHVIIVNCEKVKFTGKKWDDKNYYWHTGYIGGIKQRTAKEQLEKHPELIIQNAVKGMLPSNALGKKQLTKLRVFAGENHTHEAQNPEVLEIN
ncbi:MAG: 50S ribosomal protein L13 [Halobacteriovoraceae bacterium]|nr:50S ribosomal protein L13 [Halobacteriovoraceae bacterium]